MNDSLFLDVSTIITLVSDICNDPNIAYRFGDIQKWRECKKFAYEQIIDELQDPVIDKLRELLVNKNLLICNTAKNRLDSIILCNGSKNEILLYNNLIKHIKVVNDDPSERFIKLEGKHWDTKNRNIYGTADKYKIPIVTGNLSIINYLVNEANMDYLYIAHRSRCFIGSVYEK